MKLHIWIVIGIGLLIFFGSAAALPVGKDGPMLPLQYGQAHISSGELIPVDGEMEEVGDAAGTTLDGLTPDEISQITYIDFIHTPEGTVAVSKYGVADSAAGYKLPGYKWKAFPVKWYIDTANNDAWLSENDQYTDMLKSLKTWDQATGKNLKRVVGRISVFGAIEPGWNTGSPDGYNVFEMDGVGWINSHMGTGTIGLCRVYYIPATHKIVESDILLNEGYGWSSQVAPHAGTMRVQNIGTHEAGHAFGLSDLYASTYKPATMYGYSSYDETKKCSLWTGDIQGIRKLYGA